MTVAPAKIGWPALPVASWTPTRQTLHMWLQIVGKIRMLHSPPINHWWHSTLYVTARGMSTGPVPYEDGVFDIEFDLIDHALQIRRSTGSRAEVPLRSVSVAEFYRETRASLAGLGITADIHPSPNEVETAIPFADDTVHATYDPDRAHFFWLQLVAAERVLARFRAEYVGKSSPVHFFWGGMDLAVTRFSGRSAPPYPGAAPNCPPHVMLEGYSHELSSAGFWPGGGKEGAFYSYAYPSPEGFATSPVPAGAFFSDDLGEFLLPYETVRKADDPDGLVLDFLRATARAAATLADWEQARPR